MGLNVGQNSAQANTSQTSSQANTYSGGQSALQDLITQHLSTLIPSMSSGTLSPDVQAQETGAADTINKTSASLGDRMQKFLAARGFGKSGQSGQVQLQTELGRQSALGANASAAGATQLQLNSSYLSDALQAAYAKLGSSDQGSGSSSGTNDGFGFSASVGGPFGGPMVLGH